MRKRKHTVKAAVLTCILSLMLCMPVYAAVTDSAGNLFESGNNVSLSDMPVFGAFAAGEEVTMKDGNAKGSVAAAAKDIVFSHSEIGESAYLGGETVTLKNTDVGGNIFACGRTISIKGKSNSIYVAGESIDFNGKTKCLRFYGANAKIKGTIKGDVYIEADDISIAPKTKIIGNLTVKSEAEPEIPKTANIKSYKFKQEKQKEPKDAETSEDNGAKKPSDVISKKIPVTIYWIVAMSLLGIFMCILFNRHLEKAGDLFMNRRGVMIRNGILSWLFIPIVALVMCITVILAPAGGALLLAYTLLIFAGDSFAGASLSRLIFPKMNVCLAAVIGIAVLEVIKQIPYLGFIAGAIADMYLLAYAVTAITEKNRPVEQTDTNSQ